MKNKPIHILKMEMGCDLSLVQQARTQARLRAWTLLERSDLYYLPYDFDIEEETSAEGSLVVDSYYVVIL